MGYVLFILVAFVMLGIQTVAARVEKHKHANPRA